MRLPVRADEGMWTFNNVPRAEIKRKYNFNVTDEWLRKVQLASIRFNNGGSGSFVSSEGLVLTNHHIAQDTLAKLSTPENDLVKNGFLARTRLDERKAPDLELNVLISIEDVTARVNNSTREGMAAAEANAARTAEIARIEEESLKATGLRSDVVTLYQGGQYNLYRYRRYTDVRLVFAPEGQAAFFGGDPDNFNYPRFNLDMALFRVYENDQPLRVENYFKWSTAGAKAGELVFVPGNPGSTQRLNTMAHLEFLRTLGLPFQIKYLERRRALLQRYGAQGTEQRRRANEEIYSIENSLKSLRGQVAGLNNKQIMRRKQGEEQTLRRTVASDARKQKEYGDAWDAISRARLSLNSYERERRFLDSAWGFNSTLFNFARTILRLADESGKPNAARLPEYTDARRKSLELTLYSPAPIYEDLEQAKLADSLAFMRDELGANNPLVRKVLNGKTPEARAAELIGGTRLKDVEYRRQFAQGGSAAIQSSNDLMLQLARAIDVEARAIRTRYEDEVANVERTAYAKVARAIFDTKGTSVAPDATFTLRLAYGVIKGYEENSKQIAPFTTFAGLYERAAANGNRPPYDLPPRWIERKQNLNLQTPFNFITTADTIGGNSGSPIINTRAELVGLNFDRNIHGLVGNFIYDETQKRNIGVHSRGMIEALRHIYGANELADELTK
ncbi:MAG: S46 family peptidase [Pyrinomonadaceae bacterium]|nr:S46 family peptidase [Pyrinomonadaceae bacterium]